QSACLLPRLLTTRAYPDRTRGRSGHIPYRASRRRQPGSAEERVFHELIGEPLVTLGERMAGVAILVTGQRRRKGVGDVPLAQPGPDRGLDLLISLQTLRREQVLVERADLDEHPVSSLLKKLDHPLKRTPLQRRFQVDPGIVLAEDTALVPRLRQVSARVV